MFCLLAELNLTSEAEAGEVDKIALLTPKKQIKKRVQLRRFAGGVFFSNAPAESARVYGARLRDWAAGRLQVIQQKRCGGIPSCLYAVADWDDEPQV